MGASKKKVPVQHDKDIELKPVWSGRSVKIMRSKGRVPDALLGSYTDEATAMVAIKLFQSGVK